MSRLRRTASVAAALAATAILVGAGAAIAAGDDESSEDLSALAERIRTKDAFATAIAKELGTTAAKLEAAIAEAAGDRIDAAEQAGTLSAADAATLRQAIADGDRVALRIAQGADVAKKLGVTEAKLDEAYATVQKANALERVDEAEKAGRITAERAKELRERIESAELQGFGEAGLGHHGHRPGGPGLEGRGFGALGFDGPGPGGHGMGLAGIPHEHGDLDGEAYRGTGSSSPDEGAATAEGQASAVVT